jgi:outer membrane protein assembly factor BamB
LAGCQSRLLFKYESISIVSIKALTGDVNLKERQIGIRCIIISSLATALVTAQDWPSHMQDNHRSGVSQAYLSVPMTLAWTYQAAGAPAPAWTESPATHDYLHDWFDLKARQNFDVCFNTSIAKGRVYFGSSGTGEIVCLDLATGKRLWSFFTDAPVRFAPTISDNRVYSGSDDGLMYCLDAQTGALIWSERIGDEDMIWGNEHSISVWPVRSSVLVQDASVYWAAGLFPQEKMYLAKRNARNGQGGWTVDVPLAPQGYLLATQQTLIVPSGKTYPMMFDMVTGKFIDYLYQSTRDGGAWAIVLPDGQQLASGPTVAGSTNLYASPQREFITKMNYANCLIADKQAYYYNTNSTLGKISSTDKTKLWHTEKACPYTLIMDQQHIYAGGDGEFSVFNKTDGQVLWSAPVSGKVYGLAISNRTLLVSTDQGAVYAYQADLPSMSHLSGFVTGLGTAKVQAKLQDTGGSACRVSLCYGLENSDSDESLWQHTLDLGNYEQPGALQGRLEHLQANRLYYCSIRAQNESGQVWLNPLCLMTAPLDVQVEPAQIDESPSRVIFKICRPSWAADCDMPIHYRLTGSASSTEDYQVPAETLAFTRGQADIHLPVDIQEDLTCEENETISFQFEPGRYQLVPQGKAILTIRDNDTLSGDFAHRMKIQFSGYAGQDALSDIPVLIRLRNGVAGFRYADLQDSDGRDLVFTTADGQTLLAYDIEHWDRAGESLIWVCVPCIRSSKDTILAQWGNPESPKQNYNANGRAWPGYAHVWHFNEKGSSLMDSVDPDQMSIPLGGIHMGVAGISSGAIQLDGDDDAVELGKPLAMGTGSHTIMVWAKVPLAASQGLAPQERVGVVLGNHSDSPNSNWELYTQGQMRAWWNNGQIDQHGSTDLRDNQWHCLAWVRDKPAGQLCLYIDGELESSCDQAGTDLVFTSPHRIGADNRAGNSPNYHGLLDEMRIARRALSQSELRFHWKNVIQSRGFITYIPN